MSKKDIKSLIPDDEDDEEDEGNFIEYILVNQNQQIPIKTENHNNFIDPGIVYTEENGNDEDELFDFDNINNERGFNSNPRNTYKFGDANNGRIEIPENQISYTENDLANNHLLTLEKLFGSISNVRDSYERYIENPMVEFVGIIAAICGRDKEQMLKTGFENIMKELKLALRYRNVSKNYGSFNEDTKLVLENLTRILNGEKVDVAIKDAKSNNIIDSKLSSLVVNNFIIQEMKTLPEFAEKLYLGDEIKMGMTQVQNDLLNIYQIDITKNELFANYRSNFALTIGYAILSNDRIINNSYTSRINHRNLEVKKQNSMTALVNQIRNSGRFGSIFSGFGQPSTAITINEINRLSNTNQNQQILFSSNSNKLFRVDNASFY